MNTKHSHFTYFIIIFLITFMSLGCGGSNFDLTSDADAGSDGGDSSAEDVAEAAADSDAGQDADPEADASLDAVVEADALLDAVEDTVVDQSTDAVEDADADTDADASEDVAEDVLQDALEDVEADAPNDQVTDAPEDVEADAPEEADAPPTLCETYGEDGVLMIYTSVSTSQSLVIKGAVDFPTGSGESDIPWKWFCWSEKGNATMACFPCPGNASCDQPDASYPRVPAIAGSVVDFQPWRAPAQYDDPENTLCNINGCNVGFYVLCAGYDEICRSDNGALTGSASYEGSGSNSYIHCPI